MRNKFVYKSIGLLIKARNRVLKPVTFGVRAIVQDTDNKILLVKHSYGDQWYLPGGGMHKDETLVQALKRELKEELGLEFRQMPKLLGSYINMYEHKRDFVSVFFIRDHFAISAKKDHEIEQWRFFSADNLPPGTSPGTQRRIDEHLGKRQIDFIW